MRSGTNLRINIAIVSWLVGASGFNYPPIILSPDERLVCIHQFCRRCLHQPPNATLWRIIVRSTSFNVGLFACFASIMDRCRIRSLFHGANSALTVRQVPDEDRFRNLFGHNPTVGRYVCLFTARWPNYNVPLVVGDKTIRSASHIVKQGYTSNARAAKLT